MARKDSLRRVVILCCSFGRNLAYYRVGWRKEHQHLLNLDPANNDVTPFWVAVNNNFFDMCVLEWCKLFVDKKGKHHWQEIIRNTADFKAGLLAHLRLDEGGFQKEIETMREYRDRFVAHLDSAKTGFLPRLEVPKNAVWFYHAYVVNREAKPADFAGLQVELDRGYKECEDESDGVYKRAAGSRAL